MSNSRHLSVSKDNRILRYIVVLVSWCAAPAVTEQSNPREAGPVAVAADKSHLWLCC